MEVERHPADTGWYLLFVEINPAERCEFSFPGIEIDGSSCRSARDHEVHRAVIVKIGRDDARTRRCKTERRFCRHIPERAVPTFAPHAIVRRRAGSVDIRLF